MSVERLLIVSPVYNEAGFLDRTAAALAAQERPPDQWVIVDDGSSDRTLEIAREWERKLDFVTVIKAAQVSHIEGADNLALAREGAGVQPRSRACRPARLHAHRQARR